MHQSRFYFKSIINFILIYFLFISLAKSEDKKPHVVFWAGEEEYGAHWSLPKIADDLERRFNIKSTVIHSWRSGVTDYDMPGEVTIPEYDEIKGLEIIKDADLLVMHIRFRIPPPEQYELLQEYFDSGKPAIALRTTSHGMWPMDKKDWFVPFFGGHYKGHAGNEEGTTTIVNGEQLDHPILRGVPKFRFWNDRAGIYITAPLNDTATPLMMGKTGVNGPAQPVTWINEYKKGQKLMYTSLGGLEQFRHPDFINMIYNAIYWTLDREVPEHGVLDNRDLSFYENESPFDVGAFGVLNNNPHNRPQEDLAIENSVILNGKFEKMQIPAAPSTNIPENAVILFDGKDKSKWRHWDLSVRPVAMLPDARAVSPSPPYDEARWEIIDGSLEAKPGYGSIMTREDYGNYKLHVDFLIPNEPDYVPEKFRGTGGIFLNGKYEIEIKDSYKKDPTIISNGSVFSLIAPSSNPSKKINTWQSLDIEYRHYQGGKPEITVYLNGVKIHDKVVPKVGKTPYGIRNVSTLFMSNEKDGSSKYNLNNKNWAVETEFKTSEGGYLFSSAPMNGRWTDGSKGLRLWWDNMLVYRDGGGAPGSNWLDGYKFLYEPDNVEFNLSDNNWHNVILSSKNGRLKLYIDGKFINEIENDIVDSVSDLVFRIGQSSKVFKLGASELPDPFPAEVFAGEIKKLTFYNKSLKDSDIKKLMSGEKLSKKMIELDWDPSKMKTSKIVQKGPIRIQSDLSKIRYSNIWLQPLDE